MYDDFDEDLIEDDPNEDIEPVEDDYEPPEEAFIKRNPEPDDEEDKIVWKAKLSQAVDDEHAKFRSPQRGPYET